MTHFSEEDLIAYQLHESSDEAAIKRHLDECSDCAAVSDSIAETLRVFSSEPVPPPDLDRNWQRLRGNLSVLTPAPRRARFPRFLLWPTAGLAAAALLLFAFVGIHITHNGDRIADLLPSLDRLNHTNTAINGHGPLTTEPTAAADPGMANHLDAAERLLTEVNHTSGPLDPADRAQARQLLLSNAVYTRTARDHGNLAQAAVLDDLGRVLTTLDNEPPSPHKTLQVRLEMNTSGLLLDIRILRQNDERQNENRQ
ncbi:MAG: hypothetical protein BGO25_12745 [Acidobacteriales bacterium 59-55]|nr:hypothetical protein [Terriglobales bacterium]OJV43992.1 MAG: hypothetical protein BGO25_12745 [Acidobacteriales bacterium 59-55]